MSLWSAGVLLEMWVREGNSHFFSLQLPCIPPIGTVIDHIGARWEVKGVTISIQYDDDGRQAGLIYLECATLPRKGRA